MAAGVAACAAAPAPNPAAAPATPVAGSSTAAAATPPALAAAAAAADAPAIAPAAGDAPPANAASPAPRSAAPPLPTGTKVLQVGDSFADALSKELNKLLKDAGLEPAVQTKTPSYIGDWAYGQMLPQLLAKYDPDLVLITLGANEVEVPEPAERVRPVQRLVKSLGDRPCVWILPPLWKRDTGVMQVIKDNAKPCQVLDSTALVGELPRLPDHIHPSSAGRVTWATAVVDWLKRARNPAGPKPWSLGPDQP